MSQPARDLHEAPDDAPRPAASPAPPDAHPVRPSALSFADGSAATTPSGRHVTAWLLALGRLQIRRPGVPLLVCGLVTALGLLLASRLKLRTEFDQLLPESQRSVQELHRVSERTAGVSNLFVVLEGGNPELLRRFGDELVPKLAAIGPPWVGSTEDGVHQARSFLMPRSGLFASLPDLEKLRDDLDARWDYEVSKKLDTSLGDDEPPPPIDAERIRKMIGGSNAETVGHYPGGYYQAKDGGALVVVARAAVHAGDLDGSREVVRRVEQVVDAEHQKPEFAGVRVGYTGDLWTSLNEYGAVRDDLVSVGTLGVGLVLGVILLYYLRLRTLIALGVTIVAGCAWTFGVTQLVIGHLNVATGFLFSIVAGNGINFGIIYMARYLEARRLGVEVGEAIAVAHRETWLPTITAALAAAAAYGSLAVTDFRGFKHFALIGGVGMVLCWIATFTVLPAVLVVTERWHPFHGNQQRTDPRSFLDRLRHAGARYDAPFAWLVTRFPRALTVGGLALTVAGAVMVAKYVSSDPMEYDMTRLRNAQSSRLEQIRLSDLSGAIVGEATASSMAIVTDRVDQVAPLKQALEAKRDAAPPGEKPFEAIHTLSDFVPDRQAEKLPILREVADKIVRARGKHLVSDADWADIQPMLPVAGMQPFGLADLPEDLARPFTERDGTRGRIVYIEPTKGQNVDDARYLIRWADAFRKTTLPSGEIIYGSGRAVIYADMLRSIVNDVPKAVVLSLGMTALVVLLTFRRRQRAALVLVTLLVGVAWLGALLVLGGVKLNFLNFIALPITFGIGVDYAVNVVQRYGESGSAGVLSVMKSTGGAVVLCSLTTTLGYLALLSSLNQGVRSLGMAAVLGEICCLLAAVVLLPAALLWRERRARARTGADPARSWTSSQPSS